VLPSLNIFFEEGFFMCKQNLSTKEAAKYLEEIGTPFTAKTMEVWRCRKTGPVYKKIGHKVFYRPKDLDAFAEGETILTTDAV